MKTVKLIFITLLTTISCASEGPDIREDQAVEVAVSLDTGHLLTKSADPDEDKISNANLFVFNKEGDLEEHRYLDARRNGGRLPDITLSLIKGLDYSVAVCANFGYSISGIRSLDDLRNYRYHLAYPDEYKEGIPMSGIAAVTPAGPDSITVKLKRMMAKLTIDVDRSALEKNVRFSVAKISVRQSPRSATVFGKSRAEGRNDTFRTGFLKSGRDADQLNMETSPGMSRSLSLYMMENMQGDLPEGNESCSYVEIEAEYDSPEKYTRYGQYLIYRFYLGERKGNYDIERNSHYRITIRPEGDGLSEDGWRIDKTGLTDYAPKLVLHPSDYNECMPGDTVHIWCDVVPKTTPMTIDPVSHDEDEGVRELYDYEIDKDGHGLKVIPKTGGSILVYFEAGAPVNDSALALIVVDP